MKINIDITEEVLEQHLLRVISRDWDVDIIKNQFRIKGGIIDILARSKKNRDLYFVIEVKTGDIKPDAVCQVLRYTQYLNSEMSKNSRRLFYPIVIGKNISKEDSNGHLFKLLKFFNGEDYMDLSFYCGYALYNVDLKGLALGWMDVDNKKFIEDCYEKHWNVIDHLQEEIIDLEVEIRSLEDKNG